MPAADSPLLVALAVVGVIVVMTAPLAKKAINDLGLPLRTPSIIRQQAADKHLDRRRSSPA